MPQGITESALSRKALWIVELCQKYHYRFAPRLHIQLFGNRRGT
jgi:7-carboxy-7-deazaguanine synthase